MTTEFQLHHGDCLTGMRELAGESVDLVVTSPPYNLGIAYSKYADDAARDEYLQWSQCANGCFRMKGRFH